MARPFKSFIADPRKKYDCRFNSAERKMLVDLAKRLGLDTSKCIRRAVAWLDHDQSLLSLDPDDLRRIEDIMKAGGAKTKGEAASEALKAHRTKCLLGDTDAEHIKLIAEGYESMGMNLQSCCHRCKQRAYHYRGKENKTLLPFYKKHTKCMRMNPANVETLEDQLQEADWMSEGDYTDVSEGVDGGDD
jgi:hypothetical protein